jgi:hypothetical protein
MLATRKLGDDRIVQTPGTNVKKLLDISPAAASKNPAVTRASSSEKPPEPYTVVVFRGSQSTEQRFVENGSHWVEQAQTKTKLR